MPRRLAWPSAELAALRRWGRPRDRILVLRPLDHYRHELLSAWFDAVVTAGEALRQLEPTVLRDVLEAPNRAALLIGAASSMVDRFVVLYRATLERLAVPFDWFAGAPGAPRADFADVEVVDHGQALRLGEYEATTDAILYDFDPEYRRRAKEREVRLDPSFGGSLRRLRLLRGVPRDGFPGVSAKEIARIERGEVARPHADTLRRIAARLGVRPDEIETY